MESELFLSEKVGSFKLKQSSIRNYGAYTQRIDEIIDVEVTKETRLEAEKGI